jgi:citrate synthase
MHTPGPWYYVSDSLTHRQFDVYSPSAAPQQHVCTVNNLSVEALWKRDAKQAEANARLIAAAPQLLSALQRLTRPDDGRGPADDDLAYALDIIRVATGEA